MTGGFPVYVRVDVMNLCTVDYEKRDVQETKEVSLSFIPWATIEADDYKHVEKGSFLIFVKERTWTELARPRRFLAHYILGKGWRCAGDLSAETRNELLTSAMGRVEV